jgi:hypothetical protein
MVMWVERYAGRGQCCNRTTLGPLPDGLEPGTRFRVNIVALAVYLRFVHPVSYRRLSRLILELYGLCISEGALDPWGRRDCPRQHWENKHRRVDIARVIPSGADPAPDSDRQHDVAREHLRWGNNSMRWGALDEATRSLIQVVAPKVRAASVANRIGRLIL